MLELSKANQQEAAIAYREAVLQASHDVAYAMIVLTSAPMMLQAQQQLLQASGVGRRRFPARRTT